MQSATPSRLKKELACLYIRGEAQRIFEIPDNLYEARAFSSPDLCSDVSAARHAAVVAAMQLIGGNPEDLRLAGAYKNGTVAKASFKRISKILMEGDPALALKLNMLISASKEEVERILNSDDKQNLSVEITRQ